MPATPQKLAGIRIEPPPSLPTARAPIPAARPAAAPALLPPDVCSSDHGLRVMPVNGLSPIAFHPNSGVVVLPRSTAPCSRSLAVAGESSFQGPAVELSRDPLRVGHPFVRTTSLIVAGTPSTRPAGAPFLPPPSLFAPSPRPPPASPPPTPVSFLCTQR